MVSVRSGDGVLPAVLLHAVFWHQRHPDVWRLAWGPAVISLCRVPRSGQCAGDPAASDLLAFASGLSLLTGSARVAGWNSSTSLSTCQWTGIQCTGTQSFSINLSPAVVGSELSLKGPVNATWATLASFASLTALNLSDNAITVSGWWAEHCPEDKRCLSSPLLTAGCSASRALSPDGSDCARPFPECVYRRAWLLSSKASSCSC